MQGQNSYSDQFIAPGALTGYQPVIRGAQAGIVSSLDADYNTENVVLTDARTLVQSANLVASEVWISGQAVYLQMVNGVARVTSSPTDLHFGFADCPKAASADNATIRIKEPARAADEAGLVMDFVTHMHLQADGLYTLRDFTAEGGTRWVYAIEAEHDGLVAPGTATLSIGDGTGANDQVLTATTFTALIGAAVAHDRFTIALAAPVALTALAISLASGPMTAGRFRLRLLLSAA